MTPPFPNSPSPAWYRSAEWKASYSKRNGVHYVGDEVIIDLNWANAAGATKKRTASFEGGTDTTTITTGDRGYYSAWSVVSGTPSYSSTHAAHGNLSCKIPAGASLEWGTPSLSDRYGRIYLYATANPAGGIRVVGLGNVYVMITDTGKPRLLDNAFGGFTLTNSISLNQWVRIEWLADNTGGNFEIKLFNDADSATPTETLGQAASIGASAGLVTLGNQIGDWGSDYWIDDLVGCATSYPGPYNPDEAIADPVTYTVRDFYGNVVSSGTFDEYQEWFSPEVPGGGWQPGWYRLYLSGSQSDTNFFDSYGATSFCVIKSDAHFVSMPAASTPDGSDNSQDLVMKGVMGLGTSRLTVEDAENPDIPTLQSDVAITQTYWTDTGTPDPDRPSREPWIDFPNGGADTPGQLAGVTAVVAALYPDCKYFEGPSNEPPMNAATAAKMQDFADAVHAGHADAKAIGPAFVDITNLAGWDDFLNAGGGAACDGISFHAYNAVTNGDMNLGKNTIDAFLALLASYGLAGKELWQTESTGGMTPVYDIYHPRRARKPLMETLLFEQKGVPRERNNWWYDVSHGFWDVPVWIENADGSLEPQAVMGRVLAEETWGKPFDSAIDFGTPGNSIFLGNVYSETIGVTVALMSTSFIEGASVTLSTTGATSPVTVVDGFGNETSVALDSGMLTIPLTEVPSYLRLPAGATASVHHVMDWPVVGLPASLSPTATSKEIEGASYPVIADDAYMSNYAAGTGIAPTTFSTPPSDATIIWDDFQTFNHLIIWCGPSWQSSGTLISFEVETSDDGIAWTPRKTVNASPLSHFEFGTDGSNVGCFLETYWNEQWIFDVRLDQDVTAKGVRVTVLEASYGGEPLSDSTYGAAFGQGNSVEGFRIQEIGIFLEEVPPPEPPPREGGGGMRNPHKKRKRKPRDRFSYIVLTSG